MRLEKLDHLGKPYHIYAESLDEGALQQFTDAMALDCVVRGALMPDAHSGYTLPIGAVLAVEGVIFPSFVGYDIGCGMCALPMSCDADLIRSPWTSKAIFEGVYKAVPVGFAHNQHETPWSEGTFLPKTDAMQEIFTRDDKNHGLRQLGSLGGGNHFIEIGVDETRQVWIVVHSGSRGVGHATATRYMRLASGDGRAREGHFGFSVNSQEGKDYITDLAFCLAFALENRREIIRRVEQVVQDYCGGEGDWNRLINRNHNHAELKDGLWIHRKGATHAEAGMLGVIPGNMRDGSFIVRGKGHPEALWSSSHGAGRALGRKQAQRVLTLESFKESMAGITALVSKDTLDEAPAAYKDIYSVMAQQQEMVEILAHEVPILNIKG